MIYYRQAGDEFEKSELPALEILHESLGYDYMQPSDVNHLREKETEVILYNRLKKQLPKLNPWMEKYPEAIDMVMEKIREENYANELNHLDTNEIIHAMYTGLSVDNLKPLMIQFDLGDGSEYQTVNLFNFKEPENNDFLVTNQLPFKKFKGHIKPDITVFVNGFPLVIIECKSPNIVDPITEAIQNNLTKYQNRNNGVDRLFFYNLFLVATCGDYAKHGCVGYDVNFYSRWSSTYPYDENEIEKLAKRAPREQEKLIIGMLNKKTLINILENYVIFDESSEAKVKKLAKHQQYRAVSKTIKQLKNTLKISSNHGGTIWHSQGSGKSLTMFWLAKKIRQELDSNIPILVVTDRITLDNQIHINFKNAGWNEPIRVENTSKLIEELNSPERKVIMCTIQKLGLKDNPDILTKKQIIVITDESHRGQFGPTATKMRSVLPNGIFFAFTATPIDKPNKQVFKIFGDEIDSYSWAESQKDGTTVGIEYKANWVPIHIKGAKLLSEEFEKKFSEMSRAEKDMIKKDHITMKNLRLATERIQNITKNIVDDFNARVGIDDFKAMIVASNREAAVRYKKALDATKNAPKSILIMTSTQGETGIEGDSWDDYHLSPEKRVEKSKEFSNSDNEYKILIVSDMLLTGYDAPVIQTLYLDHKLREHTLLQAIARVNRKYKIKQFGTVIDYINVANELQEAKEMFSVEQSRDITFDKDKLIKDLKEKWRMVMIDVRGIDPTDRDSVLEKFASPDNRDSFYSNYKKFEKALNAVMPDQAANDFLDDFVKLTVTISHIRNYLNKDKFSTKPYGKKIQQLLDKYVKSKKIKLVGSIDFDDKQFGKVIEEITGRCAQNAALVGRIKGIIKMNHPDSPVFYNTIEAQLNELLRLEKEKQIDAELLFVKLSQLHVDSQSEKQSRIKLGLRNGYEFALFGELKNSIDDKVIRVKAVKCIYDEIFPQTEFIDWSEKLTVRKDMERIIDKILAENNCSENETEHLINKIIELTKRHFFER